MPKEADRLSSFECQMVAFRLLGQWFDHLREAGVFDNTRIVLVSDHGHYGWEEPFFVYTTLEGIGGSIDAQEYNPLLMVKDFESKEFSTDNAFMTNADVPSLAMTGLVPDPVNPATGNPVNMDPKQGTFLVTTANNFNIGTNNGNTFDTTGGEWWEFTPGEIYEGANWRKVE